MRISNLRSPNHLRRFRSPGITSLAALFATASGPLAAAPPALYPVELAPGSPAESALIVKVNGATVTDTARHAEPGQFWIYGLPAMAGARCRLELTLDDDAGAAEPNVNVLDAKNKPLPLRTERAQGGVFAVIWTAPANWSAGERMRVVIGAKTGPITVHSARYLHTDPDLNGDGIPDALANWMAEGQPDVRPATVRAPDRPYTVTRTAVSPTPTLDLQTDALFTVGPDAAAIGAWKTRGYTVWTLGGTADTKDYAQKHPDELQLAADGKPITVGDSLLIEPTAARIGAEHDMFAAAIAAGSEGICLEGAEYRANAGYGAAFKQAWQGQYHEAWQPPSNSVETRYRSGRLMAGLEADQAIGLLQGFATTNPAILRMAELRSPLECAQAGLISPQWRITLQPAVQEVIGQIGPNLLHTPLRYAGTRRDQPFAQAYLGYSALRCLLRDTNKRLWLPIDPLPAGPEDSLADQKALYEQTVVAALMFGDVSAYEMAWPERLYGVAPADYSAEVNNVLAALEDMHNQTRVTPLMPDDIGVLVGDSAQWQRESPGASDLDGLYGLALPLLMRGVPVQVASLERSVDPGYLNHFRTLLLSYDYQKPLGTRTQAALADWVRRGGSLIFFGGSDAYNAVRDSWWAQAKLPTPQSDLWAQLGLDTGPPATRSAPAEDLSRYQTLLKNDAPVQDLSNRRGYTLDLTPAVQQTGSVAVRFATVSGQPAQNVFVGALELRINGQLATSFLAGSEIENRFLFYDRNSQYNGIGRTGTGAASWTYQFDNLPRGVPITLTADMANSYLVQLASAQPDFGHTLLTTHQIAGLADAYPRIRIGAAYPTTLYPQIDRLSAGDNAHSGESGVRPVSAVGKTIGLPGNGDAGAIQVLYTLRAGGAPVWMKQVGRGTVLNVGVAPGFFSASERSGGLLRALTRLAYGRAGGSYKEPDTLGVRRGRYAIVCTSSASQQVEGRSIDLFSPTLTVAEDRVVPPHSVALLYDLGPADAPPHIGFISGRVQARLETQHATAFLVRGPQGTTGMARLHRGNSRLLGARGVDRLGQPIPVQVTEEGGTVLLRYPNAPDGVAIRVGWR